HVRTLVAHEPPLALLLPDAEEARAGIQNLYDTYCQQGVSAAWERFSSFTGIDMGPPSAEAMATSERFFRHGLLPIALYEPDFSRLQSASTRVVAAGGTTSRGQFAQRGAEALAARLGSSLVEFPGGHAGFISDAKDFCALLRLTLLPDAPDRP
ncbi:MAG: hypothetical protein J2P57_16085, partial [Acidimicrobiaceae bacterium]|nr:hypothetical protein [Acidimicrobiaceae bacterium]